MILCCGEAIIDMLPGQTGTGEAAYVPHMGGAIYNTAMALGRLGAPSGFFGGISTDMLGEMLCAELSRSQVDFSLSARSPRPATLAFVKLVNGQATYAFYDEASAGRMLMPHDLPRLEAACDAMHFGGISLIAEPCGSTLEHFAMRESVYRVISIDPNIRPGMIEFPEAYIARIRRMASVADIVKFSDDDLAWFESRNDPGKDPEWWLKQGAKLVIVTKGAEGAIALTNRFEVAVEARRVTVVDTVGAGDTFDAAVLASFHDQGLLTKSAIAHLTTESVKQALDLGVKAAAVTVSRAGANPPWRSELD